ncbi:hypothetical protein FIBSPDRAFT_940551 [Athelia psychrophila]|uniref:Uncharacterized protein n=1 Tax=Athelia psychrophila TaxID=1759441 RepID=A0A167VR32_9AGAM|nr:hypothetical protein FIBSPDRAFT_940551 [Fibularhizoctonia sp. CBS 109695]
MNPNLMTLTSPLPTYTPPSHHPQNQNQNQCSGLQLNLGNHHPPGVPEQPAGAGQIKSSVWCRLARGRTFGTGLAWYLLARKQRGTPAQHGNGWPGGRWGNRLSVAWAGQRVASKTVQHRTGWPGGRWGNQLSVAWAGQRVVSKTVQHRAGWPGGRWGNQLSVAWAGQRVLFKSVQHRVGWPDQDLMRHLRTTLAGQTTS